MRVLYGWGSAGIQKGLASALLALFASMIATSVAAQRPGINEGGLLFGRSNPTVVASVTVKATPLGAPIFGQPYSITLSASGGTGPYTFTATGFPYDLSLPTNGHVISGILKSAGQSTVNFTATDKLGRSGQGTFIFTVPSPKIALTTPRLPDGKYGLPNGKVGQTYPGVTVQPRAAAGPIRLRKRDCRMASRSIRIPG